MEHDESEVERLRAEVAEFKLAFNGAERELAALRLQAETNVPPGYHHVHHCPAERDLAEARALLARWMEAKADHWKVPPVRETAALLLRGDEAP